MCLLWEGKYGWKYALCRGGFEVSGMVGLHMLAHFIAIEVLHW